MAQRVGIFFFYTSNDSIKYVMCNLCLLIHLCCYVDRVGLVEKAQLLFELHLFFPFDVKERTQEQGSSNVIVASAHREILRQSSQDTMSKSAAIEYFRPG